MPKKNKKNHESQKALVRAEVRPTTKQAEPHSGVVVRRKTTQECDCRALSAFHAWREEPLQPSFNVDDRLQRETRSSASQAIWSTPDRREITIHLRVNLLSSLTNPEASTAISGSK